MFLKMTLLKVSNQKCQNRKSQDRLSQSLIIYYRLNQNYIAQGI